MRRRALIIVSSITASIVVASFSVGITYAAYTASKSYSFGDATTITVKDIGYYFGGGHGTSADPFLVSSPTHLRNLAKLNNAGLIPDGKYFSVPNSFNWDDEDKPMQPIGLDSTHAWNGYFKGNCHTIQGLRVTATGLYAGMFGYVGGGHGGMVENICLSSPVINCAPASSLGSSTQAGFIAGYVAGSTTGTVRGIMVYGGNQNSVDSSSQPLISRAIIKANTYATVTSSASTKSIIVGGRVNASSLGIMSFVASVEDIVISDSNFTTPSTDASSQTSFSDASGSFTKSYYRNTGNSGAIVAS